MTRLLIILFVLNGLVATAQQKVLLPINNNGKWGAIDSLGNTIIPLQYNHFKPMCNFHYAIVAIDSINGVLDAENKIIVPLNYQKITFLSDSFIAAYSGDSTAIYHTKKGLMYKSKIDSMTNALNDLSYLADSIEGFVIKNYSDLGIPLRFDTFNKSFRTNRKTYYQYQYKEKKGLLNDQLEKVFPAIYNDIKIIAPGKFLLTANNKYGLADTSGRFILKCIYDTIYRHGNNFIIFNENEKYGLARLNGSIMLNATFDRISFKYQHIYTIANGMAGIRDTSGREIIKPIYNNITIKNNYWCVEVNQKVGLIDKTGKTILPPVYSELYKKEDYWYGYKNNTCFLINDKFKTITQYNCNNMLYLGTNALRIYNGYKYGLIDFNARLIIPPRYTDIQYLSENYFRVKNNYSYGVINRSGKMVLKTDYNFITAINDNAFIIRKGEKYKLADLNGRIARESYCSLWGMAEDFMLAGNDKKYGVLKSNNTLIIPIEYRDISYIKSLKLFKTKSNPKYRYIDTTKVAFYHYGIINQFGDVLIDTLYDYHKIIIDANLSQIKVQTDTALIVVFCDEDGRFIDKTYYKHWVKMSKSGTKNTWKQNPKSNSDAWGLRNYQNLKLIDYKFGIITHYSFDDSSLVLSQNRRKHFKVINNDRNENKNEYSTRYSQKYVYGVVDEKKGVELLNCTYVAIRKKDFEDANIARCITSSAKFQLVDKQMNKVGKIYGYIDDFGSTYTRINKGGKLTCKIMDTYNVETQSLDTIACLECEYGSLTCEEGLWGLIDRDGNQKIKPHYQFIQRAFNNMYIAQKEASWGVINADEEEIIPFAYQQIEHFLNPLDSKKWIQCNYLKVKKGNKWGVIDLQGNEVVACKYAGIELFANKTDSLFSVAEIHSVARPMPPHRIMRKPYIYYKKWGLINTHAQPIAPVAYSKISFIDNNNTKLLILANSYSRYGYIDSSFNILSKPLYAQAYPYFNGVARVIDSTLHYRYINKKGELITHDKFYDANDFSENKAAVSNGEFCGFINTDGRYVVDMKYIKAGSYSSNRAIVQLRTEKKFFGIFGNKIRTGFIDSLGNYPFAPKYSNCNNYHNGFAFVRKGGKSFYIDLDGKKHKFKNKVKNPRFYNNPREKLIALHQQKLTQIVVPRYLKERFTEISDFSEGVATYKVPQTFCIYSLKGEEKINSEQIKIEKVNNNIYKIQSLYGNTYINSEGNYIWSK